MTRINVGILPKQLCDQHLIAEHKEIIRVRHTQHSKTTAPDDFKLGTGHVIFFKNKLGYIVNRYNQLYEECIKRGFNVTNYISSFDGYDLSGNYIPDETAIELIKNRISERLQGMNNIRYKSCKITDTQAIKILNNG